MTSYKRDGKVGPWAEEKLTYLGDYLSAYTTILRKQAWCRGYFYLDAFAGAGRAALRLPSDGRAPSPAALLLQVSAYGIDNAEEVAYLDGSPRVALAIKHPFSRYVFIEKRPARAAQLEGMAAEYRERCRVEVIRADAAAAIEAFLADATVDWRRHRGVIFLDPFGMQVPWRTIEGIAGKGGIEIILNLPVGMAIQRLLPRSGRFSDGQRLKLTEYFGSPDWEAVIYERATDLFGEVDVRKAQGSGARLAYWYRDRLQRAFGFAPEPRLIRNSQGGHLYYLLFAGPNETGARIAAHILKQGERVRRPR